MSAVVSGEEVYREADSCAALSLQPDQRER